MEKQTNLLHNQNYNQAPTRKNRRYNHNNVGTRVVIKGFVNLSKLSEDRVGRSNILKLERRTSNNKISNTKIMLACELNNFTTAHLNVVRKLVNILTTIPVAYTNTQTGVTNSKNYEHSAVKNYTVLSNALHASKSTIHDTIKQLITCHIAKVTNKVITFNSKFFNNSRYLLIDLKSNN